MSGGTTQRSSPRGLQRLALRLPILIFRAGLGSLFGGRLILLTHVGRTSGQLRETVLEVVRHDRDLGGYIVASGWGEHAQWLQNIQHNPHVMIQPDRRRLLARAVRLPPAAAAAALAAYASRHPAAFRALSRLMIGEPLAPDAAGLARLAARVPLVALIYREAAAAPDRSL